MAALPPAAASVSQPFPLAFRSARTCPQPRRSSSDIVRPAGPLGSSLGGGRFYLVFVAGDLLMKQKTFAARVEHLEDRRLLTAYYVNPGGSDAADGLSPQTAWQSVAKVDATSFQAGDAVLFAAGATFGGTLQFGADDVGNAAAPIMVGSYGDAGARATLSAGSAADGIAISNTAGLSISGLNVVGAGQANNSYSGIRVDNALAGNVRLPYLHIDSVDVGGFGRYGITVGGSNGKSGFSDVSITNANVHDNVVGGIETHGVFSASATGYANAGVYIGHCLVHDNPGYAGSTNHVGDGIVLSDADGLTIERNVAWNNGARNT